MGSTPGERNDERNVAFRLLCKMSVRLKHTGKGWSVAVKWAWRSKRTEQKKKKEERKWESHREKETQGGHR